MKMEKPVFMQEGYHPQEVIPVEHTEALDDRDLESRFTELWESGDKIGALEAVSGKYINAKDIQSNPDLSMAIMQTSASDAYAAALLVKALEEQIDPEN